MGSPQPPLTVPIFTTDCSRLEKFPIDVLLSILENCWCFTDLEAFKNAISKLFPAFDRYENGIRKTVATNEFGSLGEAVLAIQVLELWEKEIAQSNIVSSQASCEKQIWAICNDSTNLVNYKALIPKLRELTATAEKLSILYARRVCSDRLNVREMTRFKIALYRNVIFFGLFEEDCYDLATSGYGDWESSNDHVEDLKSKFPGEDVRHPKYRARNAYLSSFTHQEVLEMDCVREFLCEIGEEVLERIQILCEGFEKDGIEGDCVHTIFDLTSQTAGAELDCFFCNKYKFSQALVTRGPIFLIKTLEKIISLDLNEQIHSREDFLRGNLNDVKVEDLRELSKEMHFSENDITDEVMAFWASKRKEYQHEEEEGRKISSSSIIQKPLPNGTKSIMDVMRVKFYERAVMDDGVIFSTNNTHMTGNGNDNYEQCGRDSGNPFPLTTPETTRPSTPMIYDRDI